MTRPLVVIGAGGFAREVLDVIEAINEDVKSVDAFEVVKVLSDPRPSHADLEPYGLSGEQYGTVASMHELPEYVEYVIAIGSPNARLRIDAEFRSSRSSPILIHPSAVVAKRQVQMGPGTILCAHVAVTNHVTLGRHVHLNLGTTVGHDVHLGNYVTTSPNVSISGNVRAADGAFFGTGAVINPGVSVGEGATVGSNATVIRAVEEFTTVVGTPAKPGRSS